MKLCSQFTHVPSTFALEFKKQYTMKLENHNLSVKRRIYSFPQEGESRAEAICRSFKLYTLVEWAAYSKVDIRIETSKNCPLLMGELSQLMFLLPFFLDVAKVTFSQSFNDANDDKILVEIKAYNRILLKFRK